MPPTCPNPSLSTQLNVAASGRAAPELPMPTAVSNACAGEWQRSKKQLSAGMDANAGP